MYSHDIYPIIPADVLHPPICYIVISLLRIKNLMYLFLNESLVIINLLDMCIIYSYTIWALYVGKIFLIQMLIMIMTFFIHILIMQLMISFLKFVVRN